MRKLELTPPWKVIQFELAAFILVFFGVMVDDVAAGFTWPHIRHGLIEAVCVLVTMVPLLILSYRRAKRLLYLEGFFKLCAWCQHVGMPNGSWISIEQLMQNNFHVTTTHSACPSCTEKLLDETLIG